MQQVYKYVIEFYTERVNRLRELVEYGRPMDRDTLAAVSLIVDDLESLITEYKESWLSELRRRS